MANLNKNEKETVMTELEKTLALLKEMNAKMDKMIYPNR